MTKIKKFAREKTILFSIIICCIFSLGMFLPGLLFSLLPDSMAVDYLNEAFNILWPVALTILCGFTFIYGRKGFGSTLVAGLPFFCIYGLLFASYLFLAIANPATQWQTPSAIIFGALTMIGVGIREEVIFRGIIVNSLAMKYATDKKGLWVAAITSSILFGCIHFTNLFVGVELIGLIAQIIGSAAIGLFHTAVYLRGGNIWVTIILHALQDAAVLFGPLFTVTTVTDIDKMSSTNIWGMLVMTGICVGLSMFLLRKSKRPAIFARLEQMRNRYDGSAEKPSETL